MREDKCRKLLRRRGRRAELGAALHVRVRIERRLRNAEYAGEADFDETVAQIRSPPDDRGAAAGYHATTSTFRLVPGAPNVSGRELSTSRQLVVPTGLGPVGRGSSNAVTAASAGTVARAPIAATAAPTAMTTKLQALRFSTGEYSLPV